MDRDIVLLADTTFYICLLDDIDRLDILASIAKSCRLLVTGLVMREISRKRDMGGLGGSMLEAAMVDNSTTRMVSSLSGKGQLRKGEHEVIALAYDMDREGLPFVLLLDDKAARKAVQYRLPHLAGRMTGTVGFVARCRTRYRILARDDALEALEAMRRSGFRAPPEAIDAAMEEVRRS